MSWQGWKGGQGLPHPFVPRMEVPAVSLLCPHVGSPACSIHTEPGAGARLRVCYCSRSVTLTA